ncbi:MAG: dethiobiotin synthase [Acidobacteria bacterium]|nr:dethiobiotin synthase [Acidobacteriota bacterium]
MGFQAALFITGTDTGVGKTAVTAALAGLLRDSGVRVAAFKPVECAAPDDPRDSDLLAGATGQEPPESVCVYSLPHPVAPAVAADIAGVQLEPSLILNRFHSLRRAHEAILVEGAGGIMVPITWRYSFLDLAADMQIPALIVARAGLGTINHTLLTYLALVDRGVAVYAIILNGSPERAGLAENTNCDAVKRMTGFDRVFRLPQVPARETRIVAVSLKEHLKVLF